LLIRSQLDHGIQGARDRLERLQALRRVIDQSLSGASRIADFDAAWRVRADVMSAIALAQSTLGREIGGDLEQLINQVDRTESFNEAVRHCAEKIHGDSEKSLDAAIRIWEASGSPNTTRPAIRKANDIINVMLQKAEREKQRLKRLLDQRWEADQHNTGMEPEQKTKRGEYANLTEKLQKFHEDLKSMDLESLLILAPDPTQASRLEELYSDVAGCLTRVQELQQAKYNLWAIQQIHTAEEVPGWPERLGQIDVRLLHPTVSALYSMAYEARMKSLDDRQQRPQAVRRLIQQPKVVIEQF
jgi:hypothetical protein